MQTVLPTLEVLLKTLAPGILWLLPFFFFLTCFL